MLSQEHQFCRIFCFLALMDNIAENSFMEGPIIFKLRLFDYLFLHLFAPCYAGKSTYKQFMDKS